MTCPHCHGIGQGKTCHACLNASRAAFGMAPIDPDEPQEVEHWSKPLMWTLAMFALACLFAAARGIPLQFPFS